MSYRLTRKTSYKDRTIWHFSTLGLSGKVLKGLSFVTVVHAGKRKKFSSVSDAKTYIDSLERLRRK